MGEDNFHVGEMFAGVGGFRLGLEGPPSKEWETEFLKFEETGFKVLWSNQWEPGSSKQWASKIYEERFGNEGHSNDDIHNIALNKGKMKETIHEKIPNLDVLVGGFPCQDYSVARTVSGELGIKGEKGKLWIPIRNIIRHKRPRPKVVLLENVPRLLNSPANARGLNFAIILDDLLDLGYHVEWRVINAADYGMPQQRNRVFILAYRTDGTGQNYRANGKLNFACKIAGRRDSMSKWIFENGPFGEAFPSTGKLDDKPELVPSLNHKFSSKSSPFQNTGYAWKQKQGNIRRNMFWTTRVKADYDGEKMKLENVLDDDYDIDYEVDSSRIDEWRYAKGSKNEFRLRKRDRENVAPELVELYDECMSAPFGERADKWKEHRHRSWRKLARTNLPVRRGAMRFDSPDRPSRTVVTDEIGRTPSRMRHIIEYDEGRYRRLSPEETERLNGFPAGWTDIEGIKPSRRGFMMGNALVIGIIQRLREPIRELIRRRSV